jgi:hypothetical protein
MNSRRETLGLALAEATQFPLVLGPILKPDQASFVELAYFFAFGTEPSAAIVDSFLSVLDFFVDLYTDSGAFGTDVNRIDLLARGAVYGGMLGIAAEIDGLASDQLCAAAAVV